METGLVWFSPSTHGPESFPTSSPPERILATHSTRSTLGPPSHSASRPRRICAAVPAVSDRLRRAREAFVAAEVAGTADMEAFLEELKGVALEANRLRQGVLSELVAAVGGYQATLYLEALSHFVLSMHDPEVLHRFDQCCPSPGS